MITPLVICSHNIPPVEYYRCMVRIDNQHLFETHQAFLEGEFTSVGNEHTSDIEKLSKSNSNHLDELAGGSQTAKLWINYVKYVNAIQQYLHAE